MASKLVRNEQAKLMATYLNNVGVGSFVAGFFVPILQKPGASLTVMALSIVLGALIGFAFHYMGAFMLRNLEE